jgi:serine/threonine protein kinase
MGVMPKIPNIVIVFEYMSFGSLYNLLHLKKSINMTLEQRLKIAKDAAMVFSYMHSLGIVHRDLKSHNILVDENFNIKVCDFGLARFKADLNKGTMQYSGTPAYMSPELF